MKTKLVQLVVLVVAMFTFQAGFAQVVKNAENWGKQGITKNTDNLKGTILNYSLTEYAFKDVLVNGEEMQSVVIPDVFLSNEEGSPDLPGYSKYIAVPEGARVSFKIVSSRTEKFYNINIAPSPKTPLDTEDGPLVYKKNVSIYSRNAFFPKDPVSISERIELRGISTIKLGIIPFQYNPVTKELVVYKDLVIQVSFEGGNGIVGNNKSKNRYWDAMLKSNILNTDILPSTDITKDAMTDAGSGGCEYLIITPNNPDFLAWADSIKQFRTLQGIQTNVVTTSEIGGNTVSAIESYIDNAYTNWSISPAAVLLLGDYDTNAMSNTGITSQLFPHPGGYPAFVSDNKYADVTGDDLPDIVLARIPAVNATQLSVMISKFLNYERNPPTRAAFYNNPITALGWQTDRWFQLCSEIVCGYLKNVKRKMPIRINALYSGAPEVDPWSTAGNTSSVLNYFGPTGLGYIPATPQEIGGFTGGTSTAVANAINNGSYMLLHRDHGYYSGWGEPSFNTTSINLLHNVNNELPYIFSINCQTGAFHRSAESFAEKFYRYTYNGQNSGALGILAATEVSYSFVNDAYLWGVFDNMYPDFMPDKATTFPTSFVMPAFANVAGKYALSQNSWVGNSVKQVTYRLFHHLGDAFMTVYTEVPKALTVKHDATLLNNATSFTVTADAGSFIALVVNGAIIGKADGTGSPIVFNIPPQNAGDILHVTVTKQNYFRYSSQVKISGTSTIAANFSGSPISITANTKVNFTDLTSNNPTAWSWSFPGGTPSTSTTQHPSVTYTTPGIYNVTLTAGNSTGNSTLTKTGYITVNFAAPVANLSANKTSVTAGETINYTDLSTNSPTTWSWSFPGGTPSTSTIQHPSVTYTTPGIYNVTLIAGNSSGNSTLTKTGLITVNIAAPVANLSANKTFVTAGETVSYTDLSTNSPTTWSWSFPGGTPSASTVQNPQVVYSSAGIYNVTLTVTNTSGTNTITKSSYITVSSGVPVVSFSANKTTVIAGESITYTDMSSNNPTSWLWSFPGGSPSSSTLQNPVVTYTNAGNYSVSLTASNIAGSATQTKTGYITANIAPPVAEFASNTALVLNGSTINFNDLSTGGPTSWSWNFEGGTPLTSSAQNPSVTYKTNGVYNVSLTVSNAGGSGSKVKAGYITVTNGTMSYCPSYSVTAQTEWIAQVKLGTFAKASNGSTYSDYTLTPIPLVSGTAVSLSLTTGFSGKSRREYWKVWIDYNKDGDFVDPGENVFLGSGQKGSTSGTFTTPLGLVGSTRMRVSMKYGSYTSSPCELFTNGEVEDYMVDFSADAMPMVEELKKQTILLYPNPTKDFLNINTGIESSELFIYGMNGQILKHSILTNQDVIDVQNLAKGAYFIRIVGNGLNHTEKFIKQ